MRINTSENSAPTLPEPLPTPRSVQQIPGWVRGESTFDGLQTATPLTLVVQVTNRRTDPLSRRIVVLNRTKQSVQRTYEPERITLRDKSIRADWRVLGSVAAQQGDQKNTVSFPQLVLERQIVFLGARDTAARGETEFYGIDETGRIHWQYPPAQNGQAVPAKTEQPPSVFLNGAPLFGGLLPVRPAGSDALTLWDARTGLPIDPATAVGKATVAEAIGRAGTALVQAGERAYRLDTGASFPLPEKRVGDQAVAPLGATKERAIWVAGGDDGSMGHSTWPTYLVASDESGKRVWTFPNLKPQDYNNGDISSLPSASSLTLVNGIGEDTIAIVPVSGRDSGLYGIRVHDGKQLWKRALATASPTAPEVATQGPSATGATGFFLLRTPATALVSTGEREGKPILEYVSATTGKTQKQWTLSSGVTHIDVADDDLLTVDEGGMVRVYSCYQLFQPLQPLRK